MMTGDWTSRFQGIGQLPSPAKEQLLKMAQIVRIEKGSQIFGPTNIPEGLFFLYEGRVRVYHTSEGGREIVLYRVEAGESCVLTTACMLAEEAYNAEGVAETDITAILLPKQYFDQMVSENVAFRQFVFSAYSRRFIDLLRVVDDVAFGRIDVRLAQCLLEQGRDKKALKSTHQLLANELGTAREVISRVLQDFQKRGMINQSRGLITFLDKEALIKLAENH